MPHQWAVAPVNLGVRMWPANRPAVAVLFGKHQPEACKGVLPYCLASISLKHAKVCYRVAMVLAWFSPCQDLHGRTTADHQLDERFLRWMINADLPDSLRPSATLPICH
jgi:hypothetical protein